MRVLSVVLLLATVAMATDNIHSLAEIDDTDGHKADCEVGEHCEEMCVDQCSGTVDALCIDGSCYCEVEHVEVKSAKALKKAKKLAKKNKI